MHHRRSAVRSVVPKPSSPTPHENKLSSALELISPVFHAAFVFCVLLLPGGGRGGCVLTTNMGKRVNSLHSPLFKNYKYAAFVVCCLLLGFVAWWHTNLRGSWSKGDSTSTSTSTHTCKLFCFIAVTQATRAPTPQQRVLQSESLLHQTTIGGV